MFRLFKYKNGEIKITWNEKPMLKDYEYEWRRSQIRIKTSQISTSFSLGLELKIHTGGRICYGMLAAQIKPHDEHDCVNVSLAFTSENTSRYGESCLMADTYVYKGLPEEYVEQVTQSIGSAILKKDRYPQCNIVIGDAANCEVGSSPMIFGIMADIMIDLICTGSEDEFVNMDIETFTGKYVKNIHLQY